MAAVRSPCDGFTTTVLHFKVKNTPLKDKKWKEKVQTNIQFSFCGQRKAFHQEIVPYLELVAFTIPLVTELRRSLVTCLLTHDSGRAGRIRFLVPLFCNVALRAKSLSRSLSVIVVPAFLSKSFHKSCERDFVSFFYTTQTQTYGRTFSLIKS